MKQYSSLKTIHSVYWRHTLHYLFELIFQSINVVLIGWLLLLLFSAWLPIGAVGINTLFSLFALGLLYFICRVIWFWSTNGFTIRTFFHRIEEHHPEIANRASMLVYAEQDPSEIERLGYSNELIAADDSWLRGYMSQWKGKVKGLPSAASVVILVLLTAAWSAVCILEPEFVSNQNQKISSALWVRGYSDSSFTLEIPKTIMVARGNPIELKAALPEDAQVNEAFIHIASRSGWRSYSGTIENQTLSFSVPAVRQAMTYYFSANEVLSNQGQVNPLDPPVVQSSKITVTPPEYTGLSTAKYTVLRPLSVPEGSMIEMSIEASTRLTAAHYFTGDASGELNVVENTMSRTFQFYDNTALSFAMTDTNQLTGKTPVFPVTIIKDKAPSVEIISPKPHSSMPDELVQTVQVQVDEDYRLERVLSHYWINGKEDEPKHIMLWQYSPEAAEQAGSDKSFYLSYQWDLAQNMLFPGDEVSFYVEAWDNDGLNGSKSGKSDVHIIRYPSLTDLLELIAEQEEQQVDELSDIVREQEQISSDLKETTDQIAEKIKEQAFQEEDTEFYEEKKQLENLKDRQQQLVDKAKELEESLESFEENIQSSMPEDQQQQQGFSMEMMEKIQRVRELMQELLDEDSKKMMDNIEKTVQKLSEDIQPEDLKEMEFSVDDFKKQLDRTLNMLENNVMERQMDGLKELTQDLAERQDHLERENQQIMEEEQLLNQKQNELNALMQELQDMENQQLALMNQEEQNQGEQSNPQQGEQSPDQQNPENQSGESPENQEDQNNPSGENPDNKGEKNDSESSENQQENNEQENNEQENNEQNGEQSEESNANEEKKQEIEEALKELERKREELETRKELLEERQEKLNDDTGNMFEKIDQMKDNLQPTNPEISKRMEKLKHNAEQQGLMQEMQKSVKQMQQQNMQMAQSHQQNAEKQLREMAEQMEEQMSQMGMQQMQFNLEVITRLIDRGLFLSDKVEDLTVSSNADAQRSIHRARSYSTETKRIQTEWDEIAQINPFMSQTVYDLLTKSKTKMDQAIESSQGVKWVALHESRQSLIALNDALYTMLEDMREMQQQMEQQMQQSQSEDIQDQLQQMMQQQQSLGQKMEELRQMGQQGQQMMERLKQMAQQQSMIRQQIQQMMQEYQNARQMRNQLQGIYEEMKEVEGMLNEGVNNEEVAEKQNRIMTRLLEAGTFQEKDEFGKTRKAEAAKASTEGDLPDDLPDMPIEQRSNKAIHPDEEDIPSPFREAIKNYYIKLNESLLN